MGLSQQQRRLRQNREKVQQPNSPRLDFYQQNGLNSLEVDLSNLPSDFINSPQAFECYVIDQAPRKWICCSLYSELDQQAQTEAEDKAKSVTDETNKIRDKNRSVKNEWRGDHSELIKLINAYIEPANQEKVSQLYDSHLAKPGTSSFNTRHFLESQFREVPQVVNICVKGELGFNCHRIVWQWEIYRCLVMDGFHKATKAVKSVKTNWTTRGYEKDMALLAWYDHAPKWSAESLYSELLNSGIGVNRICSEAEKVAGEPILVERNRPEELQYLMVKEWREMPKPICVIRRYLRELVNLSLVETFGNDYIIAESAKPDLVNLSPLRI